MSEEKLPKGWGSLPLEDISDFVIGGDWGVDPESEINEDYTLVACIRGSEIKNWREGKGKTASLRLIKQSSLEKRQLRLGDLLIEISGGGPDQPVGRVILIDEEALAQNPELPKIGTNFLRLIRLADSINSDFVNYYLQKFYISGKIVEYQGGSNNLRNLKYKEFSKIEIPFPPLPEQQRIVAKLDAVFGHLDSVREKLDRIPVLLKNFRQQVLTQAVTGELTKEWREGKDLGEWEDKSIDQLAEVISGFAFKSVDFTDQGFQVIRMGNLYNNKLDLSRNPIFLPTSFDPKIIERYTIKKGDVLLSMTGTKYKKDYGFAIEVRENGNLLLNQRIVALRPKINSTFLMYLLQNEIFRDQFFSFETGGNNQGNVGVTSLKSIDLQIPSSYEQEKIVKRVDAFFGLADKIESQYQSLKAKIDQLPQAILAKAFRGELVGQEVKEYVREEGELGMVAELEVKTFEVSKTSKV